MVAVVALFAGYALVSTFFISHLSHSEEVKP